MMAYVVMLRERVADPAELETYAQLAARAREGHSVEPLVRYGEVRTLEGPPVQGAVILRFPSVDDAQKWYSSDAYQQAMEHRLKGAEYRVFILEGVGSSA